MTNDTAPGRSGIYTSRRIRPRRGDRGGGDGDRWRWVLWAMGALVLAFGLGYLITALTLFPSSDRPPIVAVPDLRGNDASAAEPVLEDVGLQLVIGDSLPNPDIPEGQVLAQAPLPGEEVAPGTEVRVVVSAGAARRTVPLVGSMTQDQAVAALTATGFDVELVEIEDARAAGRVVRVEPEPGTQLRIPARVQLYVSTGPPLVEMPEIYGLTLDDARRTLRTQGLRAGEIEYRFGGFDAEETIIGQNPLPGASIPQGSEVAIIVSSNRLPGEFIR